MIYKAKVFYTLKVSLQHNFQALESTTENQVVTREGDLRKGATFCLLTCLAATLRSEVETLRVRGEDPVHRVKDAHKPCRDRCETFQFVAMKSHILDP